MIMTMYNVYQRRPGMRVLKITVTSIIALFAAAAAAAVNVNTATQAELQTLDGVGEARAQAIVEYREAEGDFSSKSDVTDVPGIGEKTLESIRGDITVGGE